MIFNRQKLVIASVCALVGWGVGYQMGKSKMREELMSRGLGQEVGLSHFFGLMSPFFTQPELHKEKNEQGFLNRFFGNESEEEVDGSLSDNPFSLFGHRSQQPQIETREDEKFVYLEVELSSFDKNSLNAKVEGDTVVIEGNQKEEGQSGVSSSHFYQSFPAPAGTDVSKVDMLYENNKLVLKFPKLEK